MGVDCSNFKRNRRSRNRRRLAERNTAGKQADDEDAPDHEDSSRRMVRPAFTSKNLSKNYQPYVISTGGGAFCRRSGEIPAFWPLPLHLLFFLSFPKGICFCFCFSSCHSDPERSRRGRTSFSRAFMLFFLSFPLSICFLPLLVLLHSRTLAVFRQLLRRRMGSEIARLRPHFAKPNLVNPQTTITPTNQTR